MEYISTKDAAKKWGIGERRVQFFCNNEKIPGAVFFGRQWMIPSDAEKPVDGRSKESRQKKDLFSYHFPVFIFSKYYSHPSVLTEEEKELLAAQTMYLEGYYYDSIKLCRRIIENALSPSVTFGAYLTIAYDCLLTGLIVEYQKSLAKLEAILETETIHSEDYRLLIYNLRSHVTHKADELKTIEISKLNPEAMDYLHYTFMTSELVAHIHTSVESLMVYESFERYAEAENNLPCQIAFCSLLGTILFNQKNLEKSEYYIKKACKIACANNWLNYLSKYYFPIKTVIDKCMQTESSQAIKKLYECGKSNQISWKKTATILTNQIPFKGLDPEDYELICLISLDFENVVIGEITGTKEKIIEEKIEFIIKKLGLTTREDLVVIAKKRIQQYIGDSHGLLSVSKSKIRRKAF